MCMSGMSGVAAYQQTNNVWNQQNIKTETEDTTKAQGAKVEKE